ncbi:hypothetical protein HPB49_001686 [Dermacentor silvarum]|uniref:Uncharacterized protein n=1 Tax=Dermacentor silvarum TaxID=543639 RepID=A0ACB8CJ76_DERSI|nr:hypothetical protein HPB49_001686 [Dermacentor silvarum]
MLLLLSVLVDNYCHDRGACPGSSLKPVNYIQILLTLETILALPFLIKYLAGGDPEARATASGTEPPTPCNSILATPPAMLAAPAGSAEVIRTPADDIPHAALHDVWRVAVKLPLFWADSPEAWFTRVEAQFFLARITQDRTHYDYVVAHLDARYANEVRDILANPPMANLYEHLNTELIRRLSLSEDQKVRQLQSTELAERKPSQLLHHMRALAGNMEVTNSLLRALWLQRLPPHLQAILQAQLTLPLDQLAEIYEHLAPHVRRSLAS